MLHSIPVGGKEGGKREGGRQAVFGAGRTCLRNRVISGIVFQVISLLKKGEVTEKERSEARKPAGMARNVAKFVCVCVCGVCVAVCGCHAERLVVLLCSPRRRWTIAVYRCCHGIFILSLFSFVSVCCARVL